MGVLMKGLSIYLIVLNVLGYGMMGYDKWRAKNNKWRVQEQRFFIVAALGGSVGTWIGMKHFHHKTLHKQFVYGIPLIFALQVGLLVFLAVRTYCR